MFDFVMDHEVEHSTCLVPLLYLLWIVFKDLDEVVFERKESILHRKFLIFLDFGVSFFMLFLDENVVEMVSFMYKGSIL